MTRCKKTLLFRCISFNILHLPLKRPNAEDLTKKTTCLFWMKDEEEKEGEKKSEREKLPKITQS